MRWARLIASHIDDGTAHVVAALGAHDMGGQAGAALGANRQLPRFDRVV